MGGYGIKVIAEKFFSLLQKFEGIKNLIEMVA